MLLWASQCESFTAARTAIVGISPATSIQDKYLFGTKPNRPSGGQATHTEIGAFLSGSGQGPEHQELLRLIGTLVQADQSAERGTSARIKSHAKSHIVELTDGSKWRIWPGDLAATLGWTSEAEIETLPIDDKFCSHVLIERSKGSRVRAIDARNEFAIEDLREFLRDG